LGWIGSSKTAPMIFIFSIVLGAEYLCYVKSNATFALTFYGYRTRAIISRGLYFFDTIFTLAAAYIRDNLCTKKKEILHFLSPKSTAYKRERLQIESGL
jgi:hypothetical protein